MLDISPAAAGSAALGGVVMATLAALAGRFFVPRWVEAREKFETEITKQLQGMVIERAGLLRDQATENRRLQQHIDDTNHEMKLDIMAREAVLREIEHADVNRLNVEIGKVQGRTEENARNIQGLGIRLDEMEEKAEKRHERQEELFHALDKQVDRLATAVEALSRGIGMVKRSTDPKVPE